MKKSEVTKRRIIKATQELVNEKGIEGASVREIAKKASVNVASINYYFSKKENLMGEILLLNSEELGQNLKDRMEGETENLSIESLVLLIFDGLLEKHGLHLNLKKMLLDRGIMNSDSVKNQLDSSVFSPGHSLLSDFLNEKIDGSEENLNDYTQRVSLHLWGLIDQSLFLLMGIDQNGSGHLGHAPSFVRDSLRKTTQDFGEKFSL